MGLRHTSYPRQLPIDSRLSSVGRQHQAAESTYQGTTAILHIPPTAVGPRYAAVYPRSAGFAGRRRMSRGVG